MGSTLVQRSFAAGELAPGLAARADLDKYQSAARTLRNFTVRKSGGASSRAGTRYLAATKFGGASEAFLQVFRFAAADASFAIECGDHYLRFFHNGAPVMVGATPYEIATPYPAGAFKPPSPACFTQQGAVITITHLNYPPMALRYIAAANWTLTTIVTGPTNAPPLGGAGTAGVAGARTVRYRVASARNVTYEESDPGIVIVVAACGQPTVDAPNVLTWTVDPDAAEYYIFSDAGSANGTYGYIGTSTGIATFRDVGEDPDYAFTPSLPRPLFATPLNYPAVSVVFQQRRIFAGTHTDREEVFASRTGFYNNFGIRSPLQDDDSVTFTIASEFIQPVHHLIALKQLILLTDEGEWRIEGDESGALKPTAINARQHGYVGSSFTVPVVIGETVLYVQARGNVLRDLRFDQQIDGIGGRDLTIYSSHLFKGFTITDMDYAAVPNSMVWCVRSDGALLGLTYVKDEDVWGWSRHDTEGYFESVCVVPEGDENAVYVIVRRLVGGALTRYVERFASRQFTLLADAVFVDASKTYRGTPANLISGLQHLRGKTVKVLADGLVPPGTFVVSNTGTLMLPTPASVVTIGLPITCELETLDLDIGGSSLRDKKKSVLSMSLLLEDSARGFLIGPDAAHLLALPRQSYDPPAGALVSGQVEINLNAGFTNHGRTLIRHTDPTPLTILGVLPHVDVGG